MTENQIILRLFIASVLGALIGFEREWRAHPAGLRTHTLVCLGSALIMVTNLLLFEQYHSENNNIDVTRMAAQVVSGIGFLGAGTIIRYGVNVKGLTTAASLWVVAAIGLASGAGYWMSAGATTLMVIVSLVIFRPLGSWMSQGSEARNGNGEEKS